MEVPGEIGVLATSLMPGETPSIAARGLFRSQRGPVPCVVIKKRIATGRVYKRMRGEIAARPAYLEREPRLCPSVGLSHKRPSQILRLGILTVMTEQQ